MAKEAGPNAQGVGGAALKFSQKVCPVETAEPLPGAQGSGPGAPQFWGQLRARGWHRLTQGRHIFLLTGDQLRHQTLLGAAVTTGRNGRLWLGRRSPPRQCRVLFLRGSLGSHLVLLLRSIRGVPMPQGPSGPPARPSSTCSRGEHVLSTTSVLVTSRPRISTVLGGLPSASGPISAPSSS